jgi:16S rRNA (uracil1498-N3)-methyltransferase
VPAAARQGAVTRRSGGATLPRLFVRDGLAQGVDVPVDARAVHYLAAVMRLGGGDAFLAFNGRDGEWRMTLADVTRKGARAKPIEQSRPQADEPGVRLAVAPVKGGRTEDVVEKATELGVAAIDFILTQRTVVPRINRSRMRARAIEAAEQSGRMTVPEIRDAEPLASYLSARPEDGYVLWCDETGGGPPLGRVLRELPTDLASGALILLVGPEGGLTDGERTTLKASGRARNVGLGATILRADTAAVTALAIWRDWAASR